MYIYILCNFLFNFKNKTMIKNEIKNNKTKNYVISPK